MYSADFYPEEEAAEPSKLNSGWIPSSPAKGWRAPCDPLRDSGRGALHLLFLVLPTFVTGGILHFFPGFPMWGRNLVEGALKILIFLLYLIFCSRQKDIYRVFQYHGAEHKTIFCYEAGLPLTVENVRIQPRHHPRCGTSFLFVVIFVSILVSSVVFGIWAHHQCLATDAGPSDPAAPGGGHHLRVQPLGGPPRPGQPPGQDPDGSRDVDAELYHQRAGRLHDRVRHPVAGIGAAQRKRERRVVRLFEGEQACTVAALRFPALFGPPIAPLPRKRFASSAAGGASPLSPRPPLPPRRKKLRFIRFRLRRNRTALRFFLLFPTKSRAFCGEPPLRHWCARPRRAGQSIFGRRMSCRK